MSDESAEREARAEALRQEIERIRKEGGAAPGDGDTEEEQQPRAGESINDFVQRRMRELRQKGTGGDGS